LLTDRSDADHVTLQMTCDRVAGVPSRAIWARCSAVTVTAYATTAASGQPFDATDGITLADPGRARENRGWTAGFYRWKSRL
jgi:hypothetical protein